MIEIQALSKQFPGVLAVDNITFTTNKGEVFGLLGPNGAGKTTTLRMILSILEPTSGRIMVEGINVQENALVARARIGCVLEDNGIYDRMSAEENVAFFGQLYGLDKATIRERTEKLFAALEMKDFARRRAGTFSKGMKQKVAIARALISDGPDHGRAHRRARRPDPAHDPRPAQRISPPGQDDPLLHAHHERSRRNLRPRCHH
jgi:sodium transport system ATP-binding protein